MFLWELFTALEKNHEVIGAGAAGICANKHSLSLGCQVIGFEQSDVTGATGKHKDGNNIQSSLFKRLLHNLPKEIMQFSDFPIS